jgi:chromosome segregation ATPase
VISLCSKFDALMQSVENKTYPTEDVQTFISNQLHDLRSEMLRFDDVAAESRRARESNDGVSRELEAERHRAQNLNDQLENARHVEEELKMRKAQLECQLADVGDDTRSHGSSIPDSRQEAEGLREKIKEVEDECCIAKSEVERLQQNIQKRDRKLVDYGVRQILAHGSRLANVDRLQL